MNNLLQLKGTFQQAPSKARGGGVKLPSGELVRVDVAKLQKLKKDLEDLKIRWEKQTLLPGALISVYYIKVAAKSNRIKKLLAKGSKTPNDSIVGARFSDNSEKHIITHYVSIEIICESIKLLEKSIEILNSKFSGEITNKILEKIDLKQINFSKFNFSENKFLNTIVDAYYVERFSVLEESLNLKTESIITLYETDVDTIKLMEKLGIELNQNKIIEKTTILLLPDQLELLKQKAPFLISMAVSDLKELSKDDFDFGEKQTFAIPTPKNEPIIGVIDTLFDEESYFSEWVEFKNMIPADIPISSKDYIHGTAVSSLIVDGPSLNPDLDDGCGRFRVRHFGVATAKEFSSFTILRNIKEIIISNRDIKVWNLSLGSKLGINKNFISPEAAILDEIQFKNDVIFIIAGTNTEFKGNNEFKMIGAPADSINSLVVNSVDMNNNPATYTRKGPVLSFFTKPDVSYYGGDVDNLIKVHSSERKMFVKGTSFAAPWIARKMSYLIDILGLNREVAKALIINSSTGWDKQLIDSSFIGHGIVPIKINDIIQSPDDEIQFILYGVSEKYDTYNYNLPIPQYKEKHPFIAKATLCYFPRCSRSQGVDYTDTELDISFGRIKDKIIPINNNYQNDEACRTLEKDARKYFRKWDNVKHVREVFSERKRGKKVHNHGLWGISLKTKERLDKKYGQGLKFGIVVTLKEIDGVNRIDDFIKNCILRGWLVNKIDIQNRVEIFNVAEEMIEFND